MQNEKQTKIFKVHEKLKSFRKNLINRQKAHPEGKCLLKPDNNNSWWAIFEEKKSVKQKGKGPTKRFPYGLRSPKTRDQKLEKFLSHLISSGIVKRAGKKEAQNAFELWGTKKVAGACV